MSVRRGNGTSESVGAEVEAREFGQQPDLARETARQRHARDRETGELR